jgi:hypothetical protein
MVMVQSQKILEMGKMAASDDGSGIIVGFPTILWSLPPKYLPSSSHSIRIRTMTADEPGSYGRR